jgi:hypothetical protein
MRVGAVVVSCLTILLAGCIPQTSLQPFYTEKDLILEPALLGSWTMQGEGTEEGEDVNPFAGNIWTFQQGEDKSYTLHVAGKTTGANFSAHLFRLGHALFLDLIARDFEPELPADMVEDGPVFLFFLHLFPTHTVWRVEVNGDRFTLEPLGDDWVKARIGPENPLAHVEMDDRYLLTAASEELGKLLSQAAAAEDAFLGVLELARQAPSPAPAP